ncbi:MAG TPA: helix-turn-helix transcriptional regulator [Acetobacteraceae bacterium]|nr:helix-turn-helix transcriptional regulator [Acetobacteraceae bacterium]
MLEEYGPSAAAPADVIRAFDHAATPLMLLGPLGELMAANAAARALLRHGGALAASDGLLRARRASDRAMLVKALAALADGQDAETLRFPSRDGLPGLLLVMRALPGEPPRLLAAPVDLREPPLPDAAWVARAFRLTRPEARVAALVATGTEPADIAVQLGLGIGPVQETLARVLKRTGSGSAAQLALMVSRAFAALTVPGVEPPRRGR